MIPAKQFYEVYILPTLRLLQTFDQNVDDRIGCEAAARLLLGTALAESGLNTLRQWNGNARGFFQIEPATYEDIVKRYLPPRHPTISMRLDRLTLPDIPTMFQLEGNPWLGCAVARMQYWLSPAPLPDMLDTDAMAAYWVKWYNRGGKGDPKRFVELYTTHAAPMFF